MRRGDEIKNIRSMTLTNFGQKSPRWNMELIGGTPKYMVDFDNNNS